MKTISRSDYYELAGLRLVADRHNAALKYIEEAAQAITGEEPNGHTSDYLYGSRELDELLGLLGIEKPEIT